MFCPKCGNIVDENISFCPKCGASVGKNSTNINYTNQLRNQQTQNNIPKAQIPQTMIGNKKIAFLVGVVTIATLVVIALFFAFMPKKLTEERVNKVADEFFMLFKDEGEISDELKAVSTSNLRKSEVVSMIQGVYDSAGLYGKVANLLIKVSNSELVSFNSEKNEGEAIYKVKVSFTADIDALNDILEKFDNLKIKMHFVRQKGDWLLDDVTVM